METVWAIIRAIPILDSWFQRFLVWIFNTKLGSMRVENREALIKAVRDHDQRPIEVVVGNPNAGEPSGIPGTSIVDAPPPGVSQPNGS